MRSIECTLIYVAWLTTRGVESTGIVKLKCRFIVFHLESGCRNGAITQGPFLPLINGTSLHYSTVLYSTVLHCTELNCRHCRTPDPCKQLGTIVMMGMPRDAARWYAHWTGVGEILEGEKNGTNRREEKRDSCKKKGTNIGARGEKKNEMCSMNNKKSK